MPNNHHHHHHHHQQQQCSSNSREERSSPSGQSDQTSEIGLFEPRSRRRASGSSRLANACKLRQQQQQQQQQHQQHSERTPPPTDEQLRCWEYMLEQNTQLLFDKELDTLTSVPRSTALRRGGKYITHFCSLYVDF